MKVEPKGGRVIITRETGDTRVRNESDLWYKIRNALRKQGEDVIKKEMTKDGHMVSDGIYYVRSRKPGEDSFMIWDGNYQIRDSAEEYNEKGAVTFVLEAMPA